MWGLAAMCRCDSNSFTARTNISIGPFTKYNSISPACYRPSDSGRSPISTVGFRRKARASPGLRLRAASPLARTQPRRPRRRKTLPPSALSLSPARRRARRGRGHQSRGRGLPSVIRRRCISVIAWSVRTRRWLVCVSGVSPAVRAGARPVRDPRPSSAVSAEGGGRPAGR